MRTSGSAPTFTQVARREQLVGCTIDALVEVGYPRTSVAEVARRAGVSKGVVTYHFAARDDLITAVVSSVFASAGEEVGGRLGRATVDDYVATYIEAWADYYRTHRRPMLALAEIWTSFRDDAGRLVLGPATVAEELAGVERALRAGQAAGRLRPFSPRVVAVMLKAALDGLLGQLAAEPDLDLDTWTEEMVALFAAGTRAAAVGS